LRRLQIEEEDEEDDDDEAMQLTPAMRAAVEAADALRETGNALFNKGQYEAAIPKYTQALDGLQAKGANDVTLLVKCWNNRAACACQLQQYALAHDDCTEVLRRVPTEAKALMRRAFAREALERYGEALQDMRAVVALRPGARQASAACIRLTQLVAAQAKQSEQDTARQAPPPRTPAAAPQSSAVKPSEQDQTAAAAAAAAATAADEVKLRGTAAFREGNYKKAAELYYEASRTAPECHTHFSNLALALLKLGQPQHAVTAAQRCTELAPTFAKGHYRLGQALHARGDTAAACATFRAGLAHAAGTEMTEMRRELDTCEKTLATAAASQPPEPAVVAPAAGSPAKASSNEADSPASQQRGRVDVSKAADIARRVAERAQSVQSPASALSLQSFSAFERTFLALWAKGKCSDAPRLREQLELLPAMQQSLVAFVGDSLSAELLSALVLAAEQVLSPVAPVDAAGLLCRLSCARRFDMLWMFVDKAEHKAAGEILRRAVAAGGGPNEDDIAALCKRCGIKKLSGA